MQIRDNFNTIDAYQEIIDFNLECITDWKQEIIMLLDDEQKGVQRNPRKNKGIIEFINRDI